MAVFYHRSPRQLRIATKLHHTGENYSVSGVVEVLLEAARPAHCIPRNESVFARESRDLGHHGLKYASGFDYLVMLFWKIDRRDSC